eukprot:jgi/Tetstr1/444317/TSEL_032208.t1
MSLCLELGQAGRLGRCAGCGGMLEGLVASKASVVALDQLRRAFDDKTLAIILSAAGKARAAAGFAKATPDKPAPTESAERRKPREPTATARKAAATAATADKAKANYTK